MSETKIYHAPLTLKSYAQGQFRAVFATLGVVDHDGDLTLPGAFTRGQPVIIEPWNHGPGLPVGKGVIGCDDREAWVEGRFLLETQAGREHYEAVKRLGDTVEWSYTFRIVKAGPGRDGAKRVLEKLDVHGVAPVTRGAGIGTRTEVIKGKAGEKRPTVKEMKAEIEALIEPDPKWPTPSEMKRLLDLVIGPEAEGKGQAGPTNRDMIAAAIRREYGGDVPSEEWLEVMVQSRIEGLVREQQERCPFLREDQVRQRVMRWLRRPAKR